MNNLSREQAIKAVGLTAVEAVEKENCDFTNRVMNDGTVEFSASVDAINQDGDEVKLLAYYFQDAESVDDCDDLSDLNWEVSHYEVI